MEFEPIPVLMGLAAGVLGWIMAGSMKAGFIMKLITALASIVVGYGLSYFIANK